MRNILGSQALIPGREKRFISSLQHPHQLWDSSSLLFTLIFQIFYDGILLILEEILYCLFN
jgi:hypothetical protein